MDSTLADIVEAVKGFVFNITTVLTVLVALGNELRAMPLTLRWPWLEERQHEVRRAWYVSLGVYLGLALLYAYLAHKPAALVMDALTAGMLVGGVWYLNRRHRRPRDRHLHDSDDPGTPAPRRPLGRRPRERDDEPVERVPRQRRPRPE
ncbi:MAG: hypothetical protein IT204_17600 [Fimbriimonadaceae bacterium]|nr:hypothetical protein [Fimbriimonadaceae bacterium]